MTAVTPLSEGLATIVEEQVWIRGDTGRNRYRNHKRYGSEIYEEIRANVCSVSEARWAPGSLLDPPSEFREQGRFGALR